MGIFDQLSLADRFTYESLPHHRAIRLIQLQPDEGQRHGFSLTLSTVSLDGAPEFCALSYTWRSANIAPLERVEEAGDEGPPPAMVVVRCNGKDLAVTENAFDFLCRAFSERMFQAAAPGRQPDDDPPPPPPPPSNTVPGGPYADYLWIDAISINQADLAERSHQVSVMGDIYYQASKTIVWLGKEEPHPGAKWVLSTFIPKFLELYSTKKLPYFFTRGPACTDPDLVEALGEDVCNRWRTDCVPFFFNIMIQRRWLSRGWVVQEVILKGMQGGDNVVVLCGSFATSWASLLYFLKVLGSNNWAQALKKQLRSYEASEEYPFYYIDNVLKWNTVGIIQDNTMESSNGAVPSRIFRRYGPMTDAERIHTIFFEAIVKMCPHFTDRRDNIYGCLGLVSRALPPGVDGNIMTADYTLSVADVFITATWAILKNMPYLDLLGIAGAEHHAKGFSSDDLPSWVPDFSERTSILRLSSVMTSFSINKMYDASARRSPTSSFRLADGRRLMLRGTLLSTVTQRGPSLQPFVEFLPARFDCTWLLGLLLACRGQKYVQTDMGADEALCRTLAANIIPRVSGEHDLAGSFRKWWARCILQRAVYLEEEGRTSERAKLVKLLAELHTARDERSGGWIPSPADVFDAVDGSGRGDDGGLLLASLETRVRRLGGCRRFFCCDDGRFALGLRALDVGDEVWILEGGRTPFVLRKMPEGDGRLILGEAYVHGVMYGELATPELMDRMGSVTIH